jgi:hypothetical protein
LAKKNSGESGKLFHNFKAWWELDIMKHFIAFSSDFATCIKINALSAFSFPDVPAG